MASSRDFPSDVAILHIFAGAQRGFQNLEHGGASAAVRSGNQALRNNVAERFCQAAADGVLVG